MDEGRVGRGVLRVLCIGLVRIMFFEPTINMDQRGKESMMYYCSSLAVPSFEKFIVLHRSRVTLEIHLIAENITHAGNFSSSYSRNML